MNIETVEVTEIIAAARAKQASLVAESSGHLVLALGKAMAGLPLRVTLDGVTLSTEGTVRTLGAAATVSPVASVQSQRELLASLLQVSHGPAPALRALGEGARFSQGDGHDGWLADLASALIPINRGAAKRALARLARETIRARNRGLLSAASPLPPVVIAAANTDSGGSALADEPAEEPEAAMELSVEIPVDFSEPIEAVAEPTPTATEVDVVVVEASEAIQPTQPPQPAPDQLEAEHAEPNEECPAAPTPMPVVHAQGEPPNEPIPAPEPAEPAAGGDTELVSGVAASDNSSVHAPPVEALADAVAAVEPEVPMLPVTPSPPAASSDEAGPAPLASVGAATAALVEPDEEQPFLPSPSAPISELWDAVQNVITADPADTTPTPSQPVEDRATFIGLGASADDALASEPTEHRADAPASAKRDDVDRPREERPEATDGDEPCAASADEPATPAKENADEATARAQQDGPAVAALPIAPIGDDEDEARPLPCVEQDDSVPSSVLSFESDRATLPPAPPVLSEPPAAPNPWSGEMTASPEPEAVELPDELLAEFSEAIELCHPEEAPESSRQPLEFASSAAPLSSPGATAEPAEAVESNAEEERLTVPDGAPVPTAPRADDETAEAQETVIGQDWVSPDGDEALELEPSCAVSDLTDGEPGPVDDGTSSEAPAVDASPASTDAADTPAVEAALEPAEIPPTECPSVARTVESLLDDFGHDGSPEGARSLREAARSLKRFTQVATPTPPPAQILGSPEPDSSTPSPTSGLTVSTTAEQPPSIPPQAFAPQPLRSPRTTARWTAALLVVGLVAIGAVWLRYPAFFAGADSPLSKAPAVGPIATVPESSLGTCWSELEIRDLPSPHEILLRIGESPATVTPLPTGQRLELLATAAGHSPRRIVVPAERVWDSSEGRPALSLEVSLEPEVTPAWPPAALGAVGGVGPAGTLRIATEPAGAEIWLVVAAGPERQTTTAVPCGRSAELLVVNPSDPGDQRRLTIPASEK